MDTSFERINNGKSEWLTPLEIIRALGDFDLDPCAPSNPYLIQIIPKQIQLLQQRHSEVMDCHIRVHIPSRDFSGGNINNEEMIMKVKELFAQLFGGYTTHEACGGWINESGHRIEENITLIETYSSRIGFEENLKKVLAVILDFKVRYNQESIALAVNNRFFLI